jgi:plasmid stability protein
MPALYVENIPDDLYRALRKRARDNRKSLAAEVISLLESNIPTAKELAHRREFYEHMSSLRVGSASALGAFPGAEELIREDRDR